jgi:adenylate cyclase
MVLILIITVWGGLSLFASEPLIIDNQHYTYTVGKNFEILEDKNHIYTYEKLIKDRNSIQFKTNDTPKPNFGFTNSIYWVRFKVENRSDYKDFILEIAYPQLDYITLYYQDKGGAVVKEAGDQLSIAVRDVKNRNSAFRLSLKPGSVNEFYIKIKSEGNMLMPVILWEAHAFYAKDHYEQIILGILYGLILVMILYNFFIFISIKDINYLIYVFFLVSFFLFSGTISGVTYEYFLYNFPFLINKLMAFSISAVIFTSSLFAMSFLQTKINQPRVHKILIGVLSFSFILMALSFFVKYIFIIRVSAISVIFLFVFLFAVAIKSLVNKYRPARFYVLAWSIAYVGYIIFALKNFGIIQSTFVTEYSSQIGTSILVVLLSLALADRINISKEEKEKAQSELIENQKKSLEDQITMTRSFERFVPKEFLTLLNKKSILDVTLGDSVELEMTVMFSDIRAFTTLSENMTIEENFKFVNSYLKRVNPIIVDNFGFIDKYIGDAVMALFYRKPLDAVKAAVEIQKEVQVYNGHRASVGYNPIQIGVGLHLGTLMLGTIGQESRIDTTVISDSVNLTSRLEGLNKLYGAGIIISEMIVSAAPDLPFAVRYLDNVTVKGKNKPIAIYEVIDGLQEEVAALKIKTTDLFKQGVEVLQEKGCNKALELFNEILTINPDDKAAMLYRDRCNYFIEHGFPEDWCGVWDIKEK